MIPIPILRIQPRSRPPSRRFLSPLIWAAIVFALMLAHGLWAS